MKVPLDPLCGRSRARALLKERGFALVMALGLLTVLTIAGTAVAYYATGNLTSSATSKSRMSAYDLAEAGINDAKSVLYNQLNPDGSVKAGGTSPTTPTLLSQTTIQYPDVHGSVTYAGTLDTSSYVWTVTSTGKIKNDQGYQSRTLTKTVTVRGLNVGADGSSWSRFYQDDPSTCLTIDQETIVTNFATRGPLCLVNGGAITGANTTVDVGTTVTISGADASAGANSPSAASSSGAPAWSNTSNVYTSNSSYATDVISSNGTGGSLNASGYGFSIPATAIVRGITVSVIRKSNISGHTQDSGVYLLKAGAQAGSDHHLGGTWGTSNTTKTYGNASDLWGTSWTAADVDSAGFGVKFTAKTDATGTTASVDYISVTVTYSNDTNGIGTPGTPVTQANVGDTCTYNAQSAHTPCTSTDHVYATTITSTPAGSNPALVMPQVDFDYWWANAKPGPKHFCTNPNPGLSNTFFDNDAASTSAPNGSLAVNGEMAPANSSYTCQVVENGVLKGELSWDHTTHVMTVSGTIFIDGNFRWDTDGEVVHYFGRANVMSSKDDEIDAVVCAGGSGTTLATSCLTDMSNWDMSQNMIVLMSQMDNEYDQGASGCGGAPPNCYGGHLPAGFQGILYSTADCMIHQQFQDSGPVICNTISIPHEAGGDPTYYTFPSIGNLTDGQKYGDASTATNFELDEGTQTGG